MRPSCKSGRFLSLLRPELKYSWSWFRTIFHFLYLCFHRRIITLTELFKYAFSKAFSGQRRLPYGIFWYKKVFIINLSIRAWCFTRQRPTPRLLTPVDPAVGQSCGSCVTYSPSSTVSCLPDVSHQPPPLRITANGILLSQNGALLKFHSHCRITFLLYSIKPDIKFVPSS